MCCYLKGAGQEQGTGSPLQEGHACRPFDLELPASRMETTGFCWLRDCLRHCVTAARANSYNSQPFTPGHRRLMEAGRPKPGPREQIEDSRQRRKGVRVVLDREKQTSSTAHIFPVNYYSFLEVSPRQNVGSACFRWSLATPRVGKDPGDIVQISGVVNRTTGGKGGGLNHPARLGGQSPARTGTLDSGHPPVTVDSTLIAVDNTVDMKWGTIKQVSRAE